MQLLRISDLQCAERVHVTSSHQVCHDVDSEFLATVKLFNFHAETTVYAEFGVGKTAIEKGSKTHGSI